MRGFGIGKLGTWLQGRRVDPVDGAPDLPPGRGPLVLAHVSPEARLAFAQVERRLARLRRDLRLFDVSGLPAPTVRMLAEAGSARLLLLLGSDLPMPLVAAAGQTGVPVILAAARLDRDNAAWTLRGLGRREMIGSMRRVIVTDTASQGVALRMGANRENIVLSGPVAEVRDPLPCSEAERAVLVPFLRNRHTWLAAAVPPSEEDAVLFAHQAALAQSHRALLILSPADPARVAPLAQRIEADGLVAARRDRDEDPADEVQVMLTDGPTELGLWYRLAPVTFAGGTLSGNDAAARHPFEPAALGSAIVHGPAIGRHRAEWRQLDAAGAARPVADAGGLAAAVAELSQPDLIAALAGNAWRVSTSGAEVVQRICVEILDAIAAGRS